MAVISVSLELIAEEPGSTEITGDDFGTVIKIIAEGVTISGFTITHCGNNPNNAGILIHTPYNTIVNNTIEDNNYYGICILEGTNNTIYHNNILENSYQAFDAPAANNWDAGYPAGGNFWDDYEPTDADEDGIGDTSYPTGNSSADRYPLLHPYRTIRNADTHENFLSIQAGIDDPDTLNGHELIINKGIFWEHLLITKWFTLVSVSDDSAIIDGRFSGNVVTICADNVTITGFMRKRDLQADTPLPLAPFLRNLGFSAFDLGRIVNELMKRSSLFAKARQVKLASDIPSGLPKVLGDPRKLSLAFESVFLVAIEASPKGSTITVAVTKDVLDKKMLRVSVSCKVPARHVQRMVDIIGQPIEQFEDAFKDMRSKTFGCCCRVGRSSSTAGWPARSWVRKGPSP